MTIKWPQWYLAIVLLNLTLQSGKFLQSKSPAKHSGRLTPSSL